MSSLSYPAGIFVPALSAFTRIHHFHLRSSDRYLRFPLCDKKHFSPKWLPASLEIGQLSRHFFHPPQNISICVRRPHEREIDKYLQDPRWRITANKITISKQNRMYRHIKRLAGITKLQFSVGCLFTGRSNCRDVEHSQLNIPTANCANLMRYMNIPAITVD